MIKEAIDRILQLRDVHTVEIGGKTYTNEGLHWVNPDHVPSPDILEFHTLSGLSDFLSTYPVEVDSAFVHVVKHDLVYLRGELRPADGNERWSYAKATVGGTPFRFGQYLDLDRFIIALQSQFYQTEDTKQIMEWLGHLANESIVENKDDGFSQSINIKTGLTTKSKVKIVNPVYLQPWRTFRDIVQPSSPCVLRLNRTKEGIEAALFEADGEEWKVSAIKRIKDWFVSTCPGVAVLA